MSIILDPKPRRVGWKTSGPPVSFQVRSRVGRSASSLSFQVSETMPVSLESAPYLKGVGGKFVEGEGERKRTFGREIDFGAIDQNPAGAMFGNDGLGECAQLRRVVVGVDEDVMPAAESAQARKEGWLGGCHVGVVFQRLRRDSLHQGEDILDAVRKLVAQQDLLILEGLESGDVS